MPSWPKELSPQQLIPVAWMAQECSSPAPMPVTAEDRPLGVTGTLDELYVLLPNCPSLLEPQQRAPPGLTTAQVWLYPALDAQRGSHQAGHLHWRETAFVFAVP